MVSTRSSRQRRRATWKRFGAAAALGVAAYSRYNQLKDKNSVWAKTRRRPTFSGGEVTAQRDSKVQYVRKRMPRFKKRPWIKFVKKVDWISNHRQTHFTHISHFEYSTVSAPGGQYIAPEQVHYGFYGNAVRRNNTIDRWLGEQGLNTTALRKGKKFFISSICDDYTVKNGGSTDAEVDVFELVCTQDMRFSIGTGLPVDYPSMEQILDELAADDKTFGSSLSVLGVNPFTVPSWSRRFKVIRKIKHFLTPGAFFTHQVRTSKDMHFSCDSFIPQDDNALSVGQMPGLLMKKGLSRLTLFVHRGEPESDGVAGFRIGASTLIVAKVTTCHGAIIDPTQQDKVDN